MSIGRTRNRTRPGVEALDVRLTPSVTAVAALSIPPHVPGDVNNDGSVGTDDLRTYASAYLSHDGDANFNPAVDFGHTGFIGHADAKPILRALAPVTPRGPLRVFLTLGPGDQVLGHHPANSGGVTRRADVTIIGRTTPNSIVFTDDPYGARSRTAGNYKFTDLALPVESSGYFSYRLHVRDPLVQTEYLVFDPFGNQTIRAFPIRRLPA